MSSLFKQISQEAAQQRRQVDQLADSATQPNPVQPEAIPNQPVSTAQMPRPTHPAALQPSVVPKSGTAAPHTGIVVPQLDTEKLQIIIQELAQLPTNSNGINVRVSAQEMRDIEEFVHETLRKQGLKGHHVSIAKLMRYALRYLFRVHEREFVAALKQALAVEDKLSI
jgi:hypothetical protein